MPKFVAIKTFKLDFIGAEWKDCYIKFTSTTINENKQILEQQVSNKPALEINNFLTDLFARHFIEGVAYDSESKSVIPLKVEDLGELPSGIQEKMVTFLVGDTTT